MSALWGRRYCLHFTSEELSHLPRNTQFTVAGLWDTNPALSGIRVVNPILSSHLFIHSLTENHYCVPGTELDAEDTGGLGPDFIELTANCERQ